MRSFPVTTDLLRQVNLLNPETDAQVASLSAGTQRQLGDPSFFDAGSADLEQIIFGQRTFDTGRRGFDPMSAKGRRQAKIARWRARKSIATPERTTMVGNTADGQSFIDHTTKTSAMWRTMLNIRTAQVLWNPLLVTSAPVEAFIRRSIDMVAGTLTGETIGGVGAAQARISERFSDTSVGAVAQQLGLDVKLSSDQIKRLKILRSALAQRREYRDMIYSEIAYQYDSVPGIGRIERLTEKAAKAGSRLQDPAWGMLPRDLATKYLESALRNMSRNPLGENIYSVDTLIEGLTRDPRWLEKNDRAAHQMAMNSLANMRSVKSNILSLMTRGIVEPWAESGRGWLFNSSGNFVRMMTLFQNFWTTWGINTLGLQGVAEFAAFMADGRQKKLGARLQAAIRGEAQPDFEADNAEYYDMSPVLESVDLADAFIRGGVTHTALFLFGLGAQGLGLSGDDDEEKWRRRQAELQGGGFINDPRKLAEDFRNKDAIYLDFLPDFLTEALGMNVQTPDGEVHSIAQMNWIAKTFLSPIIGMERFTTRATSARSSTASAMRSVPTR